MNIAIIGSRGYPYVYSGYETFVKELGDRLVGKGVGVTVYCHRNLFRERPREVNGIRLVYIPTIEKKTLSQFIHSLQSILHACFCRYDAILVVNSANGPFGIFLRLFRKKTAINVDGMEWLRPKWRGLGGKYFYWASKLATRLFNVIITDSREMQKIYMDEFSAASTMIAYGADIVDKPGPQWLEKWNLAPHSYYLIVGRLIPDNNTDLIVREFCRSASIKKLVVVGDVPYRDEFATRIKGTDDERLVFTGYIRDQELLRELYQNAFAYFHGHEFGGTNPSLLQALANCCAVLALDTIFSREVLDEGKYGLFFSKEEGVLAGKVDWLEANPVEAERLRQISQQRIRECYTWEMITDQYCQMLKNLINNSNVSRQS